MPCWKSRSTSFREWPTQRSGCQKGKSRSSWTGSSRIGVMSPVLDPEHILRSRLSRSNPQGDEARFWAVVESEAFGGRLSCQRLVGSCRRPPARVSPRYVAGTVQQARSDSAADWLLKVAEQKRLAISDGVWEVLRAGPALLDSPRLPTGPPKTMRIAPHRTKCSLRLGGDLVGLQLAVLCGQPRSLQSPRLCHPQQLLLLRVKRPSQCQVRVAGTAGRTPGDVDHLRRNDRRAARGRLGRRVPDQHADHCHGDLARPSLSRLSLLPGRDRWSRLVGEHKPGGTPARWTDESGRPLFQGLAPDNCDRGPYVHFCGYFYQNNYTAHVA